MTRTLEGVLGIGVAGVGLCFLALLFEALLGNKGSSALLLGLLSLSGIGTVTGIALAVRSFLSVGRTPGLSSGKIEKQILSYARLEGGKVTAPEVAIRCGLTLRCAGATGLGRVRSTSGIGLRCRSVLVSGFLDQR